MNLSSVQNLIGKTLDVQSIFQQSIGQSDLVTRQTEAHLAVEREHQRTSIEEGMASSEGKGAGLDLVDIRLPEEKRKQYRLAFKNGQGVSVEITSPLPERKGRLDLQA